MYYVNMYKYIDLYIYERERERERERCIGEEWGMWKRVSEQE